MKNLLCEAEEKIVIPWDKYISMAQWCNEVLTYDGFVYLIRRCNEKDNVFKDYPCDDLINVQRLKSKKFSTDPFYSPAYFFDKSGKAIAYINDFYLADLQKILSPDFVLPSDLFDKDMAVNFYVLALKKAFYEMSIMDNPPVKAALYFAGVLTEICKRVAMFHSQIEQEESIKTQNSKNKRWSVIKNLLFIENHPKYKDLQELMSKLDENPKPKEKDEIVKKMDAIISKIIKKDEPKTLKRYRDKIITTRYSEHVDNKTTSLIRRINGLPT